MCRVSSTPLVSGLLAVWWVGGVFGVVPGPNGGDGWVELVFAMGSMLT